MIKKIILLFLLICSTIFLVNSATTPYPGYSGYFVYYYLNDDSFAFRIANSASAARLDLKYYDGPSGSQLLNSNICQVSYDGSKIISNFNIATYNSFVNGLIASNILDKNYYMKAEVEYRLYRDSSLLETRAGGNVLITPSGVPFTFNNPYSETQVQSDYGFGNYIVKAFVSPKNELKCDFNKNGLVDISEYISAIKNLATYNIVNPDHDGDGFSNTEDNCPYTWNGIVNGVGQEDLDSDGLGDVCDSDDDNDGVDDSSDSCQTLPHFISPVNYVSSNGCILDDDNDNIPNDIDICQGYDDSINSDGDSVPNGCDACPSVTGELARGGCPAYSKVFCEGEDQSGEAPSYVDFNGGYLSCSQSSMSGGDYIEFFSESQISSNPNCRPQGRDKEERDCPSGVGIISFSGSISSVSPNRGPGRYACFNKDSGADDMLGFCDLEFHPIENEVFCTLPDISATTIQSGVSKRLFKERVYEFGEDIEFRDVTCNNGQLWSGGSIYNSGSFKHLNFFQLGPDTVGTDYDDNTGIITYDDDDTQYKTEYDLETETLTFIEEDGTSTTVNTAAFNTSNKNIKIYKQGVLDREEEVDPIVIALKAHKIRKFKDKEDLVNYVDKSVDVMTKFDIVKNLTYDVIENKTRVQIRMEDIPTAEQTNITIYQVISKDLAESIDDINFISDGGAQRLIIDKDPVIGWYFNDSDDNESIEYEVEGESEGGTIIITQEPILFNEGELIINYREGGCNPDEAYLFDLEDLEESNVYGTGSGQTYNVCIAHLTETLYANTAHTPDLHLFSYTAASNASIDDSYGVSDIDISVDQTLPNIYWDMKIQESNPNGNYSCLGSINNEQSSLFGDCGYTLNRIWLHLGADYYPPNTTMSYPYLSHSVRVELDAQDNIGGSGVDKTYYCFDDEGECNAITEYTQPFTITCAQDWGCVKYVRFYSTDIEGNIEELQTQNIRILDKGSACSADCTAKPSPNRYLKECRNLNSCEYFAAPWEVDEDKGEYVAEQCDFLIKDSWVAYNDSHDIQCPSGPLRLTKFTSLGTDTSASFCKNVIKTPYITLFDGQQVIMNILNCAN